MFNILDKNIEHLLQDFINQLQGGVVKVKKFRTQHQDKKAYIDFLEDKQILRIDYTNPKSRTYEISYIGLYLSNCELSKAIFKTIDRIANLLRERYENDPSDEIYITVESIETSLGITHEEFIGAYRFLHDFTRLAGAIDLNRKDAKILLGESLLDFIQFSEIPEGMLKNRFPEDFNLQNVNKKSHGNTESNASKRELVLGAAIFVLSKFPDQCRATKGLNEVMGAKVADLIDQKSQLLFESGEPPFSKDKISRIVNKWINKIK
jgi:hypothetical protein